MDYFHFNYDDFLKQKHSAFKTPENIIFETVKKATESEIATKQRLIIGETNEVYDVKTKNGKELIIRIFHGNQNRFTNEDWAMKQASKLKVPVSRILLIEEKDFDNGHIVACVVAKIPGTPLSELNEKDKNEFGERYITQAGNILSKIHKVKAYGYGELLNGGKGEHKSYREWLEKIISKKQIYSQASLKNNISEKLITKSIQIIKEHLELFGNEPPSLCHSDFTPKHLIVNDGEIKGIIDFGNCQGGSPVHDFSWWHFWQRNQSEIQWLKKGYEEKSIFDDKFDIKFHLIKMLISLELLEWNNNIGHLIGVNLSEENLIEDVDFFNS